MKSLLMLCLPFLLYTSSCKEDNSTASTDLPDTTSTDAKIVSVSVSGEEGSYSFNVGIKSPDTGCDQYADWWEVISEGGQLLYRRILAHSHVNEQPFSRSGSPVVIKKDQIVFVRAHMNTNGYGNEVFKGSVETGFEKNMLDKTFADQLELVAPLPGGCAF